MITNNMLLKLKKHDDESVSRAQEILLGMQGKIEFLRDLKVNVDIGHGPASYDIAVIAKYDSMKDFEAYLTHPVHVEVSKYITGVLDSVAAVCYES